MGHRPALLVIVLLSLVTAACAGPSAAAPANSKPAVTIQDVQVRATDALRFEPATIRVKRGTPVRLTLANTGALDHDRVVDNLDGKLDGKKVRVEARPRASASIEFTPTSTGTYEFYCSVPGHREAGMKGTLTVQ